MGRKLFCELSPLTYKISLEKGILLRKIKDSLSKEKFSKEKREEKLPYIIYKHNSLIRRKLGNVDMQLQENKATNLALSAPKITGVIIKPGETFSLWQLVGRCSAKDGYKEGLTISSGETSSGIGGGMCQLSNLIHWMVLHTDLTITEHHHHDQIDMFPDFKRVIPFGTGTSISYNYLDYRFKNNTDLTYQLVIYVTKEYLRGELRADQRQKNKYHISAEEIYFSKEKDGNVYRNGKVYREKIDRETGNVVDKELIKVNHAKVCYDTNHLEIVDLTKKRCKKTKKQ